MHQHTEVWREKDTKSNEEGFGIQIANAWYWYQNWVDEVEKHCITKKEKHKL